MGTCFKTHCGQQNCACHCGWLDNDWNFYFLVNCSFKPTRCPDITDFNWLSVGMLSVIGRTTVNLTQSRSGQKRAGWLKWQYKCLSLLQLTEGFILKIWFIFLWCDYNLYFLCITLCCKMTVKGTFEPFLFNYKMMTKLQPITASWYFQLWTS